MELLQIGMDSPILKSLDSRQKLLYRHRSCKRHFRHNGRRTAPNRLHKPVLRISVLPSSQAQSTKSTETADQTVRHTNGSRSAEQDEVRERINSGSHASTSTSIAEEVEINMAQQLIASQNPRLSLEQIEKTFKFPLDSFQKESVQHLLEGRSVLVCAPTGAGKTAIAEAATIAALARGQRVIYTTPLKALSNQKLFEMRTQFGFGNVGLQTGDVSLNAEGDIVVMTTEILRNILFREGEAADDMAENARMADVGLVVLDEVHYLGDVDRGSVWEELIISCPRRIPLLCMSATVRNPDELGGWISKVHGECSTVITTFRPIPLNWNFAFSGDGETQMVPFFSEKKKLNPLLSGREYLEESDDEDSLGDRRGRRRGKRKAFYRSPEQQLMDSLEGKAPCIEEVLQLLQQRDLLPCIWFLLSRVGCDNAVIRLQTQKLGVLSPSGKAQVAQAVQKLREEQPEAVREDMLPALMNGFASHHAGCLPAWKGLIEELYQRGLVKVVFATGTLAAGINMPARSTVIDSVSRRIKGRNVSLKNNELMQMAGRAGRRGFDVEGHCIILQDKVELPEGVYDLMAQGPEPLQSHFATGYGMVLKVLHSRSLASARVFVERSFYNYLAEEGVAVKRKMAQEKAQKAAELIKEADAQQQAAKTDLTDVFPQYQAAKKAYQEKRTSFLKLLKSLLILRGSTAAALMEKKGLPLVVGLELGKHAFKDEDLDYMPALVICNKRSNFRFEAKRDYLCLTADNRLLQFNARHVAALGNPKKPLVAAQTLVAMQLAKKVEDWDLQKESGVFATSGSGKTASLAAKLSGADLTVIRGNNPRLKAEAEEAERELHESRVKATELQAKASEARATVPYLQLRAQATALKREANALLSELEMSSYAKEDSWKAFECTLSVLVTAGALDAESYKATTLGEVAREINSENELRTALVLTHAAVQDLDAKELAAVLSSIIASEFNHRPNMFVGYGCSNATLEAIEAMEPDREWLYNLQVRAGIDAPLGVDIRLSGLVEAWAAGASWQQLMSDCNLDGGDMARLLNRTVDLLRQTSHCSVLTQGVRKAAREAVKSMSRAPITDTVS